MTAISASPSWQELASSSHYSTAVAVREALRLGNVEAALLGTTELIDSMSKIERRAMRSHLVVLMMHIIKWKTQREYRSRSWSVTIMNARNEIEDIQEETPSITRSVIEAAWDTAFNKAIRFAEAEMNAPSSLQSLSWQEVFDDDYEYELPFDL
jgi:Domain of unknown function DUF29